MPLAPAVLLALAAQCAPNVAAPTLLAVVQVESGGDPLAIGVNRPGARALRPTSPAQAVRLAEALIGAGRSVDLGLGQINSRNLARLRLSTREAFDPCRNLAAAGQVLAEGYARAARDLGAGQAALRVALSYYNTGHALRGLQNGYAAKVVAAAGAATRPPGPARPPLPPAAGPAAWDVFGRARAATALPLSALQGAAP